MRIKELKIALKFGDNDFRDLFTEIFATMYDTWGRTSWSNDGNEGGLFTEDKSKIAWLIRSLIPAYYAMQDNMDDKLNIEYISDSKFINAVDYAVSLVSEDRIMVGSEVDDLISTTTWANSEIVIINSASEDYERIIYTL